MSEQDHETRNTVLGISLGVVVGVIVFSLIFMYHFDQQHPKNMQEISQAKSCFKLYSIKDEIGNQGSIPWQGYYQIEMKSLESKAEELKC